MVNSRLGLVTATPIGYGGKPFHLPGALLIPKLRSQCAEFLNERSLIRLGILSPPTCVGVRYGQLTNSLEVFLGGMELASWLGLPRASPQALRLMGVRICLDTPSTLTAALFHQCLRSSFRVTPLVITRINWCRNIDLLSIGYAFRPGLRNRLTLRGLPLLRKP